MRIIILLLSLFLSLNLVSGHGGGTDSKGGHHDKKNGGYHYHHGNPAHQHKNGKCLLDDKVNRTERSNMSVNGNQTDYSGWYVAGAILLSFSGYNLYQRNQNLKVKKQ